MSPLFINMNVSPAAVRAACDGIATPSAIPRYMVYHQQLRDGSTHAHYVEMFNNSNPIGCTNVTLVGDLGKVSKFHQQCLVCRISPSWCYQSLGLCSAAAHHVFGAWPQGLCEFALTFVPGTELYFVSYGTLSRHPIWFTGDRVVVYFKGTQWNPVILGQ